MSWYDDIESFIGYQRWTNLKKYSNQISGSTSGIVANASVAYTCDRSSISSGNTNRYTHSGDFEFTETHESSNGDNGDDLVWDSSESKVFVVNVTDEDVLVLDDSDLTKSATIAIGFTPLPSIHLEGGYVWVIENVDVDQTVMRIDPSDNSTTTFTLDSYSLCQTVVWDSTNSKIMFDSVAGVTTADIDGTNQSVIATNGHGWCVTRDDGDIGIVEGSGYYRIYDVSATTLGSRILKIPKPNATEPLNKVTTDGVLICYSGVEHGQFGRTSSGAVQDPDSVIVDTTQSPSTLDETIYFSMVQNKRAGQVNNSTYNFNPYAIYAPYNAGAGDDAQTQVTGFNDPGTNMMFLHGSTLIDMSVSTFSTPTSRSFTNGVFITVDTTNNVLMSRLSAIKVTSQCSFNGTP